MMIDRKWRSDSWRSWKMARRCDATGSGHFFERRWMTTVRTVLHTISNILDANQKVRWKKIEWVLDVARHQTSLSTILPQDYSTPTKRLDKGRLSEWVTVGYCAPSNVAVDNLAEGLLDANQKVRKGNQLCAPSHLSPLPLPLRLYPPSLCLCQLCFPILCAFASLKLKIYFAPLAHDLDEL